MSSSAKSGQQHIHLDPLLDSPLFAIAKSNQHSHSHFPLLNSPKFAIAKSDHRNIHPLLNAPLFSKSGSYFRNDGHRSSSSTLDSVSTIVASPSASVAKRSSASYHQEHRQSATLANLRLTRNGTVITARWTTMQGVAKSSIDLNLHIGNIDGSLSWGYSDFSKSCVDLDLNGTIFSAFCRPRSWRGPQGYAYSEIDLMEYLHISEGVLCPNNFANCRLTCKGTVITAEWTTLQGVLKESSLDLDAYIGTIDSVLHWGERDLSKSCVSWDLRGTIFFVLCRPRTWSAKGYQYSELDLSKYLQISEGMLCVIKDVDPLSRVDSPKPLASPSKPSFNPPVPHVSPSTSPVNKPAPVHHVKFHCPTPVHHVKFHCPTPAPSADIFSIDLPILNIGLSDPQYGSSEPQSVPSNPQEVSRFDSPDPQDGFSETRVVPSEPNNMETWTRFMFRQLKRMREILRLSLARLLGRR